MDDLTRFALAWAGMLVLIAAADRALVRDRLGRARPDEGTAPADAELRLRWWVNPLLAVTSTLWCLGIRVDDARLDALLRDHGFKVVQRRG